MEGRKLTQQTILDSFAKAAKKFKEPTATTSTTNSQTQPAPRSKPNPTIPVTPTLPHPQIAPKTMGPTYYPKLKQIADETLAVLDIKNGKYPYQGRTVDIRDEMQVCNQHTRYYTPDHPWGAIRPTALNVRPTVKATVLNITTVECARLLAHVHARNSPSPGPRPEHSSGVGVLNFASATQPGGGFKKGTQAQEESIARVSSLYPSLVTREAQQYHEMHSAPGGSKDGWYTHAMIYSPNVVVFRDDDGTWAPLYKIDVLTSAAVNAGEIRKKELSGRNAKNQQALEAEIEREMYDRMARVLCLFEQERVRDLVLGSYGTGVFRNDVGVVANIWADLLIVPGAPFATSFDRVMFAITGDATFREFETTFKNKTGMTKRAPPPQQGSSGVMATIGGFFGSRQAPQ